MYSNIYLDVTFLYLNVQWNMCLDINIGIHSNTCKNEHVLEKDVYWNVCIQMVKVSC